MEFRRGSSDLPVAHLLEGFRLPENPEVFVVSNKKEDGKPKGAIYAGQYWHSDLSYVEEPALGSMPYALEFPSVGGDTMFAKLYMAYEMLSDRMKRSEGRRVGKGWGSTC